MLILPFGALVTQPFLRDASLPIMITEGEFKTLALCRMANHDSPNRPRFLPLGVSGVYKVRPLPKANCLQRLLGRSRDVGFSEVRFRRRSSKAVGGSSSERRLAKGACTGP